MVKSFLKFTHELLGFLFWKFYCKLFREDITHLDVEKLDSKSIIRKLLTWSFHNWRINARSSWLFLCAKPQLCITFGNMPEYWEASVLQSMVANLWKMWVNNQKIIWIDLLIEVLFLFSFCKKFKVYLFA